MSESKTPRTDAAWSEQDPLRKLSDNEKQVFARTLELELNEARANLVDAIKSVLDCRNLLDPNGDLSVKDAALLLRSQLTTAQQDLAKIAKALATQQQRYHDLSEEVEGLKRERDDAIESTVRKCAEMIKHKCDQWPCFDSEYCRSRTDAVNEILSLIPQKDGKV